MRMGDCWRDPALVGERLRSRDDMAEGALGGGSCTLSMVVLVLWRECALSTSWTSWVVLASSAWSPPSWSADDVVEA